ncbi:MAG TPA: PPE domain-containing protein, partial [Mycobacterium sp.]|uniref:PPE domain-containing protein n=1 Tax=Mycobacterium sp. TaxID=1785 RepID=UPI002F4234CA
PLIAANRAELTALVSNNFLGQNTGAIAQNEAEYLDMWIQDALGMDTYNLSSTSASGALPAQSVAPMVTSGASPAAALAGAAAPADATSDAFLTAILNAVAALFGGPSDGLTGLSGFDAWLPTTIAAIAANPTAALLPVQGVYYMGMLGSTPARMFMSGGSGGGASAGAGAGTLASMQESLLDNVSKLVDGKAATVMSGVGGQLSKWGAGIQASMASAMHAGGLSVPNAWHTGVPGAEVVHAGPTLPANSVAAPSMTTGLPSSPFSQGLMGALAGRGMSAMGSKVAAKVMPRSPAGG